MTLTRPKNNPTVTPRRSTSHSHGLDSRNGGLGVSEVLRQVVRLVGAQDERRRPGVGVLDGDDDGDLGGERGVAAILGHRRQAEVVVDRYLRGERESGGWWGVSGRSGAEGRQDVTA